MSKILFFFISYILSTVVAKDFSRSITTRYNPGFSANCTNQGLHVVYSKAISNSNKDDVLHYVVTAGKVGPPSVLLIASNGEGAELAFNCSNILSDNIVDRRSGIKLTSGSRVFTAGFLITRLWQFNDTKDQANMTEADQSDKIWVRYPMEEFVWTINSLQEISQTGTILLSTNATVKPQTSPQPDDMMEAEVSASNDTTTTSAPTPTPTPRSDLFRRGGRISLKITLSGPEQRRDVQPRLYFTGNSTQLDVTLNYLSLAFSGARFGLTLVHMSSLNSDDAVIKVDESESIDDEFTPGIFKMLDWKSYPKSNAPVSELHDRAFLQWKPICYTSSKRSLSASQQMYFYAPPAKIDYFDFLAMERSVAFPWFNPSGKIRNKFEALPMNISFGQTKDGFYLASNFTEWSSSMGLGEPPYDSVSLLVILIIVIGLGLPFIIIVAGFITVLIRQRRTNASTSAVYPVIN